MPEIKPAKIKETSVADEPKTKKIPCPSFYIKDEPVPETCQGCHIISCKGCPKHILTPLDCQDCKRKSCEGCSVIKPEPKIKSLLCTVCMQGKNECICYDVPLRPRTCRNCESQDHGGCFHLDELPYNCKVCKDGGTEKCLKCSTKSLDPCENCRDAGSRKCVNDGYKTVCTPPEKLEVTTPQEYSPEDEPKLAKISPISKGELAEYFKEIIALDVVDKVKDLNKANIPEFVKKAFLDNFEVIETFIEDRKLSPHRLLVTQFPSGLVKVRISNRIEVLDTFNSRIIEDLEGTGGSVAEALGTLLLKNMSDFRVKSISHLSIKDYEDV